MPLLSNLRDSVIGWYYTFVLFLLLVFLFLFLVSYLVVHNSAANADNHKTPQTTNNREKKTTDRRKQDSL